MEFRFEHLQIWKDAILFTKEIYTTTVSFSKEELFALTDQLKRASSSVPANIAEGSGSSSKKDFSHYLDIAIKSTYEVISHLELAKELKYINEKRRNELYANAEILAKRIQAFKKTICY